VEGNHLVLAVELERTWLADVGFGDGLFEPVPLVEGEVSQCGLGYRLERQGPRWLFVNQPWGSAAGFDFTIAPRRLDDSASRCRQLQTDPESSFVRATVCERFEEGAITMLRGAVLRRVTADGPTERTIRGRAEFERVLAESIGLDPGPIGPLWPAIEARHARWLERTGPRAPAEDRIESSQP
jgi:N-hydroxyarylamine O-acetyltransferase